MIRKLISFILSIGIIITISYSCIVLKRKANKGISSYNETFFINDSTLQYFIKPIEFGKEYKMILDFTFMKEGISFSQVNMNFSFINGDRKEIQNVQIITDSSKYVIDAFKLLFKEKQKANYLFRYSSKIDYNCLKDFFNSKNTAIMVNGTILLGTSNKVRETMEVINNELFEFELVE